MLGRSSCVGGPGIMNNDFYGNGKTTCRLGGKRPNMRCNEVRREAKKNKIRNEEMKPVHVQCQKERKSVCCCYCPCSSHPFPRPMLPRSKKSIPAEIPRSQNPIPVQINEEKKKNALITGSRSIPPCTLAVSPVVGCDVCCFFPLGAVLENPRKIGKGKVKKKEKGSDKYTVSNEKNDFPAFPNVTPNFLFARTNPS